MSIVETNRNLFRTPAAGFYDRGQSSGTNAAGVPNGVTSFRRATTGVVAVINTAVNFDISVVEALVAQGLCSYNLGTYTVLALGAGTYEVSFYMNTNNTYPSISILKNAVVQATALQGDYSGGPRSAVTGVNAVFTCVAGDTISVRGMDAGFTVRDTAQNGFTVKRLY